MVRSLTDPSLDDHEKRALHDIAEHGLHIIHVFPEAETPGWSFSIGLFHNYQHPEVIVFGLDRDVSHSLLNSLAEDVAAARAFEAEHDYPELLEGVRCTFKPVERIWYEPFFGWATWFYQGSDFPALQCVWPDKLQHYPWDPAFREDWLWAQPLLFHRDVGAARVAALLKSMDLDLPDRPFGNGPAA